MLKKILWLLLPMMITACATSGELEAVSQYTKSRLDDLESRIENKKLLGLLNETEAVKSQLATLRGEIELMQHDLTQTKKRQSELYNDLDARIHAQLNNPAKEDSSATNGAPLSTSQSDYQQAMSLIDQHQFDQALQLLNQIEKADSQDPQLADVVFWIGVTHVGLNQLEEAINAYRRFIEKQPDHPKAPQALYYIASCQQNLNQGDKALVTLQELIKRYPQSEAAINYQQQLQSTH